MNKEITIYDLLGLIKDDKAPKKIRFCGDIFVFRNNTYEYEDGNISLFHEYKEYFAYETIECLNDEVEILEEDKPIIEKLNIESDSPTHFYIRNEYGTKCGLTKHSKMIADKLNEVIDYINRKEDK